MKTESRQAQLSQSEWYHTLGLDSRLTIVLQSSTSYSYQNRHLYVFKAQRCSGTGADFSIMHLRCARMPYGGLCKLKYATNQA